MMGMDAGWYRDPAPANSTEPSTVRFWDGQQWTTQVKPAPRQERAAWRSEIAAQQREYAAARMANPASVGYGGEAGATRGLTSRDATPDGQRLAGWWVRVGAFVIDWLLTTAIGIAFGWRFVSQIGQAYSELVSQSLDAARAGAQPPDMTATMDGIVGPMMGLAVVLWAVKLAYGVGFLKAFQATPGKLMLGLEVRLRERPGPLSWGTVLARWFTQNIAGLLQVLPMVALFSWVYSLLNALWPLWDGNRQALHEKVARTNVVRRSS